jgi:hypothetical protein
VNLVAEVVEVGGVEAEVLPAEALERVAAFALAIRHHPLGVRVGGELVPTSREVDRATHTDLAAGVDLLGK